MRAARKSSIALVAAFALGLGACERDPTTAPQSSELESPAVAQQTNQTNAWEQKIAFASNRTGQWDIYTVNLDGSGDQNLTAHPAHDFGPAWSPDGARIIFTSTRNESVGELYVMNADGSQLKSLTTSPIKEYINAAWSPDGSMIAARLRRGPPYGQSDIVIFNVNGSANFRILTNSPFNEDSPTWSPDGNRIAYHATPSSLCPDIYVVDITSRRTTNLTNTPDRCEYWPTWSHEGDRIAFEAHGVLYDIRVDGTDYQRLPSPDGFNSAPSFRRAPGGSMVFANRRRRVTNIWVRDGETGESRRVTNFPGEHSGPSWRGMPPLPPDLAGTKILFSRDGSIHVMNPDGSDVRQLTNTSAYDSWPNGQPLGNGIVFSRGIGADLPGELFLMNADGDDVRPLGGRQPIHGEDPVWSEDGERIVWVQDGDIYLQSAKGAQQGAVGLRLTDWRHPGLGLLSPSDVSANRIPMGNGHQSPSWRKREDSSVDEEEIAYVTHPGPQQNEIYGLWIRDGYHISGGGTMFKFPLWEVYVRDADLARGLPSLPWPGVAYALRWGHIFVSPMIGPTDLPDYEPHWDPGGPDVPSRGRFIVFKRGWELYRLRFDILSMKSERVTQLTVNSAAEIEHPSWWRPSPAIVWRP